MADQPVTVDVTDLRGAVVMHLRTAGASDIPINLDPQAACELAEKMARAAHIARYGKPLQADAGYLLEQVKSRVTEQMRMLLVQRLSVMLNSLREDRTWSNGRLAAELVDVILAKVG